jgi:hypothetical protein
VRPIQRLGASPEAAQAFLFAKSHQGHLAGDPRTLALEFGCNVRRFTQLLDALVRRGDLAIETTGANARLTLFQVTPPAGFRTSAAPSADPDELIAAAPDESPDPNDDSEDYDVVGHEHPLPGEKTYEHYHAWGSMPHLHLLRAVCGRPECGDSPTHNIHPGGN